jgi:AcrR family transcriptional regulator
VFWPVFSRHQAAETGPELVMRRIAAEAGLTAMAVYTYAPSKAAL